MKVRTVTPDDPLHIADIYNHYIAASHATFEIEPVGAAEMERRVNEVLDAGYPFLVCEIDGEVAGYAYGRQFRPRAAYRHSAEVSVYVRTGYERRGVGKALYTDLLSIIKERDIHTIIAGIALPNDPSVRLHEKFGFEKIAHFREVGYKFGRWVDVGYWQLMLSK